MSKSQQSTIIEKFFQQILTDFEQKISQMITDEKILCILKNGKRLRPVLAILVFKASVQGKETPEQYHRILETMISIELAHNASLVHDDIMDEEKMRRGEPAFYRKEGIGNAILIGHKMLAIGFKIALSDGKEIAQLYVDAWKKILDGQIIEITFNDTKQNTIKDVLSSSSKLFSLYDTIIDRKTATLFSMACTAAATKAQASQKLVQLLTKYGQEIGLAYQLADDLVDLEKGEMIQSVLLPLLLKIDKKLVQNLSNKKTVLLKKKMEAHSSEIKKFYLQEIKQHIKKAEKISSLHDIPDSEYKTLLKEVPKYIINNMLKEINITI